MPSSTSPRATAMRRPTEPGRGPPGDARPTPSRVLPSRRARPTQFHVEHVVSPAYRDAARTHAFRARAFDCL